MPLHSGVKDLCSVCSVGFLVASSQYFISQGPVRRTETTVEI